MGIWDSPYRVGKSSLTEMQREGRRGPAWNPVQGGGVSKDVGSPAPRTAHGITIELGTARFSSQLWVHPMVAK